MNEEEQKRIEEIFNNLLELLKAKSIEYGDSWKNADLGARSSFIGITTKYMRLKHLLWESQDADKDRIFDTLIDLIGYSFFTILLLEEENGKKFDVWKKSEYKVPDGK